MRLAKPAAAVLIIGCFIWLVSSRGSNAAGESLVSRAVGPVSSRAVASAVSPPVRLFAAKKSTEMSSAAQSDLPVREVGPEAQKAASSPQAHDSDEHLAKDAILPMPTPSLSFDGLSNYDNINAYGLVIVPPDMNGDIGQDHYVQAVNALIRIYDRSGTPVTAPFPISSLFAPLGTPCSMRNDGEPIVQYDQLADRWLITEYCTNFPPFRQLIAVSKTGDPTGTYNLWEFVMPNIRLQDFAKFGLWPDGYYMSDEEFTGSDFSGVGMFAFDREKMLVGDPSASYIYFNIPSATPDRKRNMLPSDLDGLSVPADGTPNVFVSYTATEYGDASDALRLFDFHADFHDPEASTFAERPESPLAVAAFDPTSPALRADISQPPPGAMLDSNSDRVNYRAAYRLLPSGHSIVLNQTVRTTPGDPYRAGVRVYELRRGSSAFTVRDATTIGDGGSSRWIGGTAQDDQGNIAVSYNFVSDKEPPAIRYSGRLASEAPGTFRPEASLIDGTGVQKAFGFRWGDYNAINVDPKDDCTFWTTGEYYTQQSQDFSDFTWLTRVGTFAFPECTPAPRASIRGTVTDAVTGQPIANALVRATSYTRASDASGAYAPLNVIPGTYTVTAEKRGYLPRSFQLTLSNGDAAVQNFSLTPIPVIASGGLAVSAESCGINGVPDPGETVTLTLTLSNTGALPTTDLVATLANTGGVTNAGPPVSFGAIPAGGTASREISFTVDPALVCGARIALTFNLRDGGTDLGAVVLNLQTGTPTPIFRQNFDRGMLAQLPERWTRATTGGGRNGSISLTHSFSGPKSLFSPDSNQAGTNEIVTPVFYVRGPNARLSFEHYYNIETTFLRNRLYDGAVLEIKIGGGEWSDILAAGGSFASGGYDGAIDACCMNPLAGHLGWSGRSGIDEFPEWIPVSVHLPASAAGNFVQLRWRMGTDTGNSRVVEGEFIDDLLVTDGYTCGCAR